MSLDFFIALAIVGCLIVIARRFFDEDDGPGDGSGWPVVSSALYDTIIKP